MDPLIELLTEQLGEEQAKTIVEKMEAYKTKITEEVNAEFETRVAEGVAEKTIVLEAEYLEKLDTAKKEAEEALTTETQTYEKRLAQRVKAVLEDAAESHGDRLAQVFEQNEAREGTRLFEQLEQVFDKARQEISETQQASPDEVKILKKQVATLEGALDTANKRIMTERARANVAESNLEQIKEQADGGAQVVVEEEGGQGQGAAQGEDNDDPTVTVSEGDDGQGDGKHSPGMQRMRKLAGIA